MKTVDIEQANDSLRSYASSVKGAPLVITDRGKPVAALLPVDNADLETVSLSTNPKFLSIIEKSRQRQKREGGITSDEMRRRLKSDDTSNAADD